MELLDEEKIPKEESLIIVEEKPTKNYSNRKKILFIISIVGITLITIAVLFILVTKPMVKYKGAKVEVIEYGQGYIEQGLKVNLWNKDLSNEVKTEGQVDYNKLGEYQIKYEVPYMNHYLEYKRKVKVIDSTKPKLIVNVKEKAFINQAYNKNEYKATDNVDGDITGKVEIEGDVDITKVGIYTIRYKVKDSSGNETEVDKNVTVDNSIGTVCLTFDDGPSGNLTPKVLDILKEKNIKASFFVLNYSDDKIDIVKREISEGHTLGLHGYLHEYNQIYQSLDVAYQNVIKIQDRVRDTTGYTSKLIRFPGGSSNTVSEKYKKGLMTELTQKVIQEGYRYFDWNVSGEDAGAAKNSEDVYNYTINGLKPGRTNVVLLHDFSSNQKMLDVLPKIIDDATAQGYEFEPITEQTEAVIHNIKN